MRRVSYMNRRSAMDQRQDHHRRGRNPLKCLTAKTSGKTRGQAKSLSRVCVEMRDRKTSRIASRMEHGTVFSLFTRAIWATGGRSRIPFPRFLEPISLSLDYFNATWRVVFQQDHRCVACRQGLDSRLYLCK